jgi:MinD-like ATPase involved in chromosome partitioning or flagellar assembly
MNRARSAAERALGEHIATACRKSLGVRVRAVGALAQDKAVTHAVERCQPVLKSFPDSTFANDVYAVVERMLLPDSAQPEHSTSMGGGRIRKMLGVDRQWSEKHRRIRHLADLAGAD